MNYAQTASRPNPAAALGALGVPAAFGALLILGLAVKTAVEEEGKGLVGIFVPVEKPEPLPTPEPQLDADRATDPVATPQQEYIPTRPEAPITIVTGPTAPLGPIQPLDRDWTVPLAIPGPSPRPTPRFDPVEAAPKGNPGAWITNDDYRTSWINRGYTGIASFELQIDASGRVTDCAITGSTGYGALDAATCRLIERRARFEPARDSSGNTVAGTYGSSVRWTIPE